MSDPPHSPLPEQDRTVLRDLARRVAELAAQPEMTERLNRWKRHNALQPGRPMLMIWPEGSWRELLPPESLVCHTPETRDMEAALRRRIYAAEHFCDDMPVLADWPVAKAIRETGWGLEPQRTPSTEKHGAWKFKPVIHSAQDLKKLRVPQISHDEAASQAALQRNQDLFGDILDVKLTGRGGTGFSLMAQYTALRGLEEVMMDMVEQPEMLHEAMSFLENAHRSRIRQLEAMNLLGLNNRYAKVSSGGTGYTDELPSPGFDGQHVRLRDLWGWCESQEMAQVSPAMHAEFVMQYEGRLLEPFGLTGYGCCEDLTPKLDLVFEHIPHLRRVSISPWANVARCAEKIKRRCILSWKPQPAMLVGEFNTKAIRQHIREAIAAAQGCPMEMTLKDTHTCENKPERFDIWTRIAREEIERAS